MKLFLLLIPFMGIHCITSACFQKPAATKPIEKKEVVAFQLLPGTLFMQFGN